MTKLISRKIWVAEKFLNFSHCESQTNSIALQNLREIDIFEKFTKVEEIFSSKWRFWKDYKS